jgi:hypothetical protein
VKKNKKAFFGRSAAGRDFSRVFVVAAVPPPPPCGAHPTARETGRTNGWTSEGAFILPLKAKRRENEGGGKRSDSPGEPEESI